MGDDRMPQISIIVPVYKVEQYLRQCVDSILAQTFTDFELILVDDGSPDGSPAICDEYGCLDTRIRVIHKENGGTAAARNAGLNAAKGKWILFVDSDDYYCGDELSAFLNIVDFSRTDTLYCFDYRNVWPDHVEETTHYTDQEYLINSLPERIEFLSSQSAHNVMGYAVWDKLYSRELMESFSVRLLERDEMRHKDDWAEDLALNLQYLLHVNRVVVSGRGVYGLRKHGTPADQNENGLVGRLGHMMDIFLKIKNIKNDQYETQITENFWKLIIWHLRRYLYLEVSANGIQSLDALRQEAYYPELKNSILCALENWKEFRHRWDTVNASDYRYILQYILDGNLFAYKVKNYWLWKIKPHLK